MGAMNTIMSAIHSSEIGLRHVKGIRHSYCNNALFSENSELVLISQENRIRLSSAAALVKFTAPKSFSFCQPGVFCGNKTIIERS